MEKIVKILIMITYVIEVVLIMLILFALAFVPVDAKNVTFYQYRLIDCDYCTPNLTNSTWTKWLNARFLPFPGSNDTLCWGNRSIKFFRTKTQYDLNDCHEIANFTYYQFKLAKNWRCFCFPPYNQIRGSKCQS